MGRAGLSLVCLLFVGTVRAAAPAAVPVGMTARWEQVLLPGSELEAAPGPRTAPLVLRVVAAFPHGSAWRYDFAYYGLEPGTFDLRQYLRRKDGSTTKDLPELSVTVVAQLPAGQIEPHALPNNPGPRLSGYRSALVVGGVLWLVGLLLLWRWGRRAKPAEAPAVAAPTLADRLRPLVEQAQAGTLSPPQRAELERLLLAYWCRRLHLDAAKPVDAFRRLREHDEAGPLVRALENWLHHPEPAIMDVTALLAPYRAVAEAS